MPNLATNNPTLIKKSLQQTREMMKDMPEPTLSRLLDNARQGNKAAIQKLVVRQFTGQNTLDVMKGAYQKVGAEMNGVYDGVANFFGGGR